MSTKPKPKPKRPNPRRSTFIFRAHCFYIYLLASAPPRLVALGTIQNKKY